MKIKSPRGIQVGEMTILYLSSAMEIISSDDDDDGSMWLDEWEKWYERKKAGGPGSFLSLVVLPFPLSCST